MVTLFLIVIGFIMSGGFAQETCGTNQINDLDTTFVAGGKRGAKPGFWPWMVSYGQFERNQWKHKCSGTLVSDKHILTAAHCIKSKRWVLFIPFVNQLEEHASKL